MGDLPLRTPIHRRLGGPLPRLLSNGTHPHLLSLLLIVTPCGETIPSGVNLTFARLSLNNRQVGYVLLTRAPVAIRILLLKLYAAPRLACVKPVASVHPEPGSNSSLYKFYLIPFAQLTSFRFNLFSLLTVASYSFHSAYHRFQ